MPKVSVVLPTIRTLAAPHPGAVLGARADRGRSRGSRHRRLLQRRDPGAARPRSPTRGCASSARIPTRASPGPATARIAEARGEWVAFLDDDDFWAPTCLQRAPPRRSPTPVRPGATAPRSRSGRTGARRVMMPAPPEALEDGLLQLNLVGPPSTATVRLDLLREVGGFDEHLSVIADWDLWVRLSRRAPAALCEDAARRLLGARGGDASPAPPRAQRRARVPGRQAPGPDARRASASAPARPPARRPGTTGSPGAGSAPPAPTCGWASASARGSTCCAASPCSAASRSSPGSSPPPAPRRRSPNGSST